MANTVEIIVKATDKASNVMGTIGKGLLGITAGVAAGVAAVGAAALKLAIDAEPIVGVQSAFDGLTASMTGGSEAMLKSLQDASGGFATNTAMMTSFNKAAQLVSLDFA
jgi:hypothetical protein